uniref:Peptidyl-prolyl cis-trans isomerase n=1 Tax=Streptomyces sp. NBC_01401 TaxID=2903854 RepID=A0AAU3H099_9ACTN
MRRLAGLLVVPLLLLSTAACGDDKASDSASASKSEVPAVTAGTKFGEKPTLSKGAGDPPKKLKTEVISEGDGAKLKNGDAAEVNYLGQAWNSDKPFDNSFDRKQPFGLILGAGQVIPGWEQGLVGQKAGSRVKLTIPPDLAYGEQGQGEDIPPNTTLVFVVDVLSGKAVPKTPKGSTVAQDNIDLPKVGDNTDGKAPKVTIPKGDAPKKLVSNYVIESDGEAVKESDTVVVNYEAYVWKGAKKFDSTFESGQVASFPLAQITVKGLKSGLVGKKVGSRVLLVMPPDQGFGDQAQQTIPAKSTLVWSVDILTKM